MFAASHRRHVRETPGSPRRRRGVALVFVMVFVIAMAALAMSSIYMSSGSTLLAKSYDRERDLRFAAEVALAIGKARVNTNPGLLVLPAGQNFDTLMRKDSLLGADNRPIPGIVANVYVGITGSSSGQNGRFASIVAEAVDTVTHTSFIRRLEMTQESFAKYAYWSDRETNNGATIFFNNGDQLWGPVWSNDKISIGSGGATFNSDIGTALTIDGKEYGNFAVKPLEKQKRINLPSTAVVNVLASYAVLGGDTIQTFWGPSADESRVRDRIEFLAFDVDYSMPRDSAGPDEGFYRRYQAYNATNADSVVRGDWVGNRDDSGNPTGSLPTAASVRFCGDFHWTGTGANTRLVFYPVSVHSANWFRVQLQTAMNQLPALIPAPFTSASAYATAESQLNMPNILKHPGARCYLAGDPHLVAVDRRLGDPRGAPRFGTYDLPDVQRGGEDTTFTAKGIYGQWIPPRATPADTVLKLRKWDGRYLYAIGHSLNPNGKGVIYASGNVGISGVVNGLVTLYTPGSIVILDDVRYANDPVLGACRDILGLISGFDVVVADNAVNTPVGLSLRADSNYVFTSMHGGAQPGTIPTGQLFIHAVTMALGTSFRVENYSTGPTTGVTCGGVTNGRGCIDLSGGLIQVSRGKVGFSNGAGYSKRYTYDRCAVRHPPPYFPTTGRFADNRYLELDPVGFNAATYFSTLIPKGP